MKRFRFLLHPVAVWRAHQEACAREAYAAAVAGLSRAGDMLADARRHAARMEADMQRGRSGGFHAAGEVSTLHGYRRAAAAELAAEQAEADATESFRRHRSAYLAAHRQAEVLRRLEERARTAHRLAENRAEQAEFDDFANRRATRRRPILAP